MAFKIERTGIFAGLPKRVFNNMKKDGMAAGMIWWHRYFRANHFTNKGAREYGYAKRQGEPGRPAPTRNGKQKRSYTAEKVRRYGHSRPLVKTGRSEKLARIRDVRATSKGAKAVIHARTLNFRRPGSAINMRKEMTKITPQEARVMIRVARKKMQHLMKQYTRENRQRVTVKG